MRFQPRIVRMCSTQFLDSNREDIENIALLVLFRTTRITLHCPFHGSSAFELLLNGLYDVILLQVGLKCFSMRMTFDLFDDLLNAKIFCFFHNCMPQSWNSEVNVYFLELGGLLSTHAPRYCLMCVYVFVFVFVFVYTQLWMDFGPSTGLPVLVECLVPSRPNKTSFSISW